MGKALYISIDGINDLQASILIFIDNWVRNFKTPVPQKQIVMKMKNDGIQEFTTKNALNILLRKGYIRRGFTTSNTTQYVQLRRI